MNANPNLNPAPTSIEDLVEARNRLDARIKTERENQMTQAMSEIKAFVEKFGITQEQLDAELFPKAKGRKGSKTAANAADPKYRNPNNPDETWTGKGRRPVWYRDAVDMGTTPEQMLITN